MPNYDLGRAVGRIVIEYDDQGVGRATQDMQSARHHATSTSEAFGKAATGMGVAGLGIVAGFGLAVKASADFEKVLSGTKAVTGASTEEMDKLRQKALQIGADTSFSAGEAAQAIDELAKAGVSIPDIMNGAADATAALAAAGEIDLPQAAEIASAAMNSFKLSAKDLPNVANLIAGAANASAIDVTDFGESLKQVGAVANLAGVSFSDTATAIALMGKVGIKGSDAGTSLKTVLQNLTPSSGTAATAMKKLGIITKDGSNQFFDAKGNVKSLADISGVLQTALKDQTKEQKLAALGTIFGSDAIRAASVLADSGSKSFNKMNTEMTKTKAADVAKERLNNLSGSLETFKGSLETAMIQLGSGAQGPLKTFVDKLTGLINWFGALSDGTKQNIVVIALAVAGFLLFASALIKTVQFVQNLVRTLKILSRALHLNAIATGIKKLVLFIKQLVIVAARATAAGARIIWMGIKMAAVRAAQFASTMASAARSLALMALNAAKAGASMALMAARAVATRIALVAIRIATLAWAAAMWLVTAAMNASPIGLVIIAIVALIAVFVLLWKNSETFRRIVTEVWNAVWGVIKKVGLAIFNFVKNNWRLIISVVLGPLGIMIALVTKYWRQIYNAISFAVMAVINFVKRNWKTILAVLLGPIGIAVLLITKNWDKIKKIFSNAIKSIKGFFNGAKDWLYNAGRNIIQGLINGALSILKGLWNVFSSITDRIPKIKGPESVDKKLLTPNGQLIMQSLIDGVAKKIPELEAFMRRIGPVNIAGTMAGAAAQTASTAVLAANPSTRSVSSPASRSGLLSDADVARIADSLTLAMERRGVGATIIDGKRLEDRFGGSYGREAALRRRSG